MNHTRHLGSVSNKDIDAIYQQFWEIMRGILVQVFQEDCNVSSTLWRMTYTGPVNLLAS
jgi:hypothetical protein